MTKYKNISPFFIFIIVVFLTLIFAHSIFIHLYIYADDTDTVIASNFAEILKSPANGIYTAGIPDYFFGVFIPKIMNIHPSVFKSRYFSIVEALMISSFAIIFCRLLYKKFDYIYPFAYAFTFLMILYFCTGQSYMLFLYDGVFRIVLGTFLFILFMVCFCIYLNKPNLQNTALTSMSIFISSISNEMNFIMFVFLIPVYFMYSIIKYRLKYVYSNITFIISVILSGLVLFHSGALMRKSQNFQQISYLLSIFPEFIVVYIKSVIINHFAIYFILFILMLYLNLKYKEDYIKNLTAFSISVVFSGFIFFASLFITGKTDDNNTFYTTHPDLHVIWNIILCGLIFTFVNVLVEKKIIKLYIVFTFLLASIIYIFKIDYNFYSDLVQNTLPLEKEIVYKYEKIIRYADCKNKPAYIFLDNLTNANWYLFPDNDGDYKKGKLYDYSPYIFYFKQLENNFAINGYYFADNDKVVSEFENNGGSFTDEELKKLDFSIMRSICK